MPPTERKFWVVRAGSRGEDEDLVLSSGLAMIVFREAPFPIRPTGTPSGRRFPMRTSSKGHERGEQIGSDNSTPSPNVIEEGDSSSFYRG